MFSQASIQITEQYKAWEILGTDCMVGVCVHTAQEQGQRCRRRMLLPCIQCQENLRRQLPIHVNFWGMNKFAQNPWSFPGFLDFCSTPMFFLRLWNSTHVCGLRTIPSFGMQNIPVTNITGFREEQNVYTRSAFLWERERKRKIFIFWRLNTMSAARQNQLVRNWVLRTF